jgi:hypothetical protein
LSTGWPDSENVNFGLNFGHLKTLRSQKYGIIFSQKKYSF